MVYVSPKIGHHLFFLCLFFNSQLKRLTVSHSVIYSCYISEHGKRFAVGELCVKLPVCCNGAQEFSVTELSSKLSICSNGNQEFIITVGSNPKSAEPN
jgi:hypothetical protein